MTETLALILRAVGAVWAIGGLFIVANALKLGRSAEARWVLAGGALTVTAGVLLALGSPWAVIAAVAVAVEQAFFHWLRAREIGRAAPRPMQVWIALAVAAAAMLVARAGGSG
jgi:hypothetical protein